MSEAKLSEYDFYVVVDVSGSMGEPNKASEPNGVTRWSAMQESVMSLVRDVSKLDSDGIVVIELGGQGRTFHGVNENNVREMFATMNPRGGTPLHTALKNAFNAAGASGKKDFIMVFTDGVPDEQKTAADMIISATNSMINDDDLTVLFVQVGDDKAATAYLRGLDDNLKGARFDIVDVVTVEEAMKFATTVDLVMKAIND
jgi:Mg-chelatase subunit ChlD